MSPFETLALRILYAILTVFVTGSGVYVAKLASAPTETVVPPKVESGTSSMSSSTDIGRLQKAPGTDASLMGTLPDLGSDVFSIRGGADYSLKSASRR